MSFDKRGHTQSIILAGKVCGVSPAQVKADALADVAGLTPEEFDYFLAEVNHGEVSDSAVKALGLAMTVSSLLDDIMRAAQ